MPPTTSIGEGRARAALRAPRPWFALCLVLIVVIASYLPVLDAPFVWDDHHLIEDSPLILELHPLRDYFGQSFWQTDELGQGRAYYRPLTVLSLAIDHALYGDNAGGYHLSNLLFHLLATAFLFQLLRVRGAPGHAAALAAALWSLHPRLTEAVAWVSGRTDVLATVFVLAALLVRARTGDSLPRRSLCALFLLLGLLCKEVALAGVAAVLVFEAVSPGRLLLRVRRALPALFALASYVALRVHASGIATPRAAPARTTLLRATAALGQYAVMFIDPWLPDVQIGQLAQPRPVYALLGVVVAVAFAALLVRLRSRLTPAVCGALTLSTVALGLVLHVVPFLLNVVAADRFLYLPLVGAALLLTPLLSSMTKPRLVAGICGLLSLSFVAATFIRARAWADEVTLWSKTYRDNPENPFLGCAQLGRLYVKVGLFRNAFSLYRGCSVSPVRRFVLVSNAAAVLARTGRYQAALTLLDGLDELARRKPLIALNQALFFSDLNDFTSARAALARALRADPKSQNGLRLAQQLPARERARIELDSLPSGAPILDRARRLQSLGLTAEALIAWQAALASDSLTAQQMAEGLEFAVAQADAATLEALHRRYSDRFAGPEGAWLEQAYAARHDLSQQLLAVWPSLELPLRELPGSAPSSPGEGRP